MPAYVRSLFLALMPVLYVGWAAYRAKPPSLLGLGLLGVLFVGVTWAFRATEEVNLAGDNVGPELRRLFRLSATALATFAAAQTAPPGLPAFEMAAAISLGIGSVCTLAALARIPSGRGLVRCPPQARRMDGAIAMGLASSIAATLPAAFVFAPQWSVNIDPLSIDYALAAQALTALVLLVLVSLRSRWLRRLELGVAERCLAALTAAAASLFISLAAALTAVAASERALSWGAAGACLAIGLVSLSRHPSRLHRTLRTGLVALVGGAPLVLGVAYYAKLHPQKSGLTVLAGGVGLLLLGLLSRRLSARLSQRSWRWQKALADAQTSAALSDPELALTATLRTLRERLGPTSPSPVLFELEAETSAKVDRAGYLQRSPGIIPPEILKFCDDEPARTLRLQVARSLQVRKPEIRPTLAWMQAQGFLAVTSLALDDGPVALLALPAGGRTNPLNQDEIGSLDRLAMRLTAVVSLATSLQAAHRRIQAGEEQIRGLESRRDELQAKVDRHAAMHQARTRLLASAHGAASYSAAAQMCEEGLADLATQEKHAALLVPPGVDLAGHTATAHLRGKRAHGPCIWIEGTRPDLHPNAIWNHPQASPLALAAGGTLVVEWAHALPIPTQENLARLLLNWPKDRAAPPVVWLGLGQTLDTEVASGRISDRLADALSPRPLPLPPLSARPEDFRSLCMAAVARLGNRHHGKPVGISDEAVALLLNHGFDHNEQELELALSQAVVSSGPGRVEAADLPPQMLSGGPEDPNHFDPLTHALRQASRPRRRRRS